MNIVVGVLVVVVACAVTISAMLWCADEPRKGATSATVIARPASSVCWLVDSQYSWVS